MNRRNFLVGTLALGISGCGIDFYRQIQEQLYKEGKAREAEAIKKIIDSLVILETTVTYKLASQPDTVREHKLQGLGVVYNNFILTLDHVVSLYAIQERTPSVIREAKIDKIKEETTTSKGIPLEKIVNDKEKDIAVFRVPPNYDGMRYPFGIGDSDKIEYGQEVLIIGNPGLQGIMVREGIISSKVFIHKILKFPGFYVSTILTPGDSGGLVVDRVTYSLLGLNGQRFGGHAYIRPINLFKSIKLG